MIACSVFYDFWVGKTLNRPRAVILGFIGALHSASFSTPLVGFSFFPRTDAGQFVINVKAPTGTRIEDTEKYVIQVENIVRQEVPPSDLNTIVSNIGLVAGFSALFSPNSGMHTAFVEVGLKEGHHLSSFECMSRVRRRIATEVPEVRTYFQSGGLVDAVLNQGAPAPIDVQVSGLDLNRADEVAQDLAQKFRAIPGVADVFVPQDMDYPALELDVNRERASELGLSPEGSRGQRHHRAHLERDDRTELLGESENGQRLFRDRAVPGKPGQIHRGFESHAAARARPEDAHVPRPGRGHFANAQAHRGGSLSDPAQH